MNWEQDVLVLRRLINHWEENTGDPITKVALAEQKERMLKLYPVEDVRRAVRDIYFARLDALHT